jgi:hypothetical protein
MNLPDDERGSTHPYLMFWAVVIVIALVWIVFNEMIMHVNDWVSNSASVSDGGLWEIMITLFRFTPVVILLSALTWAIVQSHRATETPYA